MDMILHIVFPDSASSIPMEEIFGTDPANLQALTDKEFDIGLPVISISLHFSSGCHNPDSYGNLIRLALEAMDNIDAIKE